MAGFEYDLTAMEQFLTALDERIQTLESHRDEVRTTVGDLAEQYSGAAAGAFTDAQAEWQAGTSQYLEELKALRQQIETCRSNYAGAREANRQMFGWSNT